MEQKDGILLSHSDAIATSNHILQEILIFIIRTFNEINFKLFKNYFFIEEIVVSNYTKMQTQFKM